MSGAPESIKFASSSAPKVLSGSLSFALFTSRIRNSGLKDSNNAAIVGAGATNPAPTVVVLAAAAWMTFVVTVLLMSAAASLAGVVPEAMMGAISCPGAIVRNDSDSCCCEIVSKGQGVPGVPPLLIGKASVNDGGTLIYGLPRFQRWNEMLLGALIFNWDGCADADGVVDEHLNVMVMTCIHSLFVCLFVG